MKSVQIDRDLVAYVDSNGNVVRVLDMDLNISFHAPHIPNHVLDKCNKVLRKSGWKLTLYKL